jgi:hypothetical protein
VERRAREIACEKIRQRGPLRAADGTPKTVEGVAKLDTRRALVAHPDGKTGSHGGHSPRVRSSEKGGPIRETGNRRAKLSEKKLLPGGVVVAKTHPAEQKSAAVNTNQENQNNPI